MKRGRELFHTFWGREFQCLGSRAAESSATAIMATDSCVFTHATALWNPTRPVYWNQGAAKEESP